MYFIIWLPKSPTGLTQTPRPQLWLIKSTLLQHKAGHIWTATYILTQSQKWLIHGSWTMCFHTTSQSNGQIVNPKPKVTRLWLTNHVLATVRYLTIKWAVAPFICPWPIDSGNAPNDPNKDANLRNKREKAEGRAVEDIKGYPVYLQPSTLMENEVKSSYKIPGYKYTNI